MTQQITVVFDDVPYMGPRGSTVTGQSHVTCGDCGYVFSIFDNSPMCDHWVRAEVSDKALHDLIDGIE